MEKFILKKPVIYETKKHEAFDLSGLEDLSGEEYASLLKQAENIDGMDMVPEKSLTFAYLTAAKVTGLPFDLFKMLGAKDAAQLRYTIGNFFSQRIRPYRRLVAQKICHQPFYHSAR